MPYGRGHLGSRFFKPAANADDAIDPTDNIIEPAGSSAASSTADRVQQIMLVIIMLLY